MRSAGTRRRFATAGACAGRTRRASRAAHPARLIAARQPALHLPIAARALSGMSCPIQDPPPTRVPAAHAPRSPARTLARELADHPAYTRRRAARRGPAHAGGAEPAPSAWRQGGQGGIAAAGAVEPLPVSRERLLSNSRAGRERSRAAPRAADATPPGLAQSAPRPALPRCAGRMRTVRGRRVVATCRGLADAPAGPQSSARSLLARSSSWAASSCRRRTRSTIA
jgi:hypothetical protein